MASPAEIASAAYDAGIRDAVALARATAIALAESGGNPRAHNRVPPDNSYGLWQINMYGNLGPARRAQFGLASNEELFDIRTNARAMYAISGGGKNWRPWTTYGGARYLVVYPAVQAIIPGVLAAKGAGRVGEAAEQVGENAAEAIAGPLDALQTAAQSLVKTGAWLSDRNNWFRVAKVSAGLALLAGGLFLAARPLLGKAAATTVQAVLPVGKAAKAVKAVGG